MPRQQLIRGMKGLNVEQCEADACFMRLVEAGAVSIFRSSRARL